VEQMCGTDMCLATPTLCFDARSRKSKFINKESPFFSFFYLGFEGRRTQALGVGANFGINIIFPCIDNMQAFPQLVPRRCHLISCFGSQASFGIRLVCTKMAGFI